MKAQAQLREQDAAVASAVQADKDQLWLVSMLKSLDECDEMFIATAHRFVDLNDDSTVAEATDWWTRMMGGVRFGRRRSAEIRSTSGSPTGRSIGSR
ncbi:MAG: hypothetical protein H6812_03560 [Phycisphaeraceae bacterium]|nr:hypothetical protein [Phycisphaerales bacterium]MCB9842316.1 hypothetical protein [Phycisphaeraceae bacterium]